MKSTLFIMAALCLFLAPASAQQFNTVPAPDSQQQRDANAPEGSKNGLAEHSIFYRWSLGVGYALPFIRQFDVSEDNSLALMPSVDIRIADIGEDLAVTLRPAFLYTGSAAIVDLGLCANYGSSMSISAGVGMDVAGESERQGTRPDGTWTYTLERDGIAKRLFSLIGVRYGISSVFAELQYRAQIEAGTHAWWSHDELPGYRLSTGYRRQFIVVLLLGVSL